MFIKGFESRDIESMLQSITWFRKRITIMEADNFSVSQFLNTGIMPYMLEVIGFSDDCLDKL